MFFLFPESLCRFLTGNNNDVIEILRDVQYVRENEREMQVKLVRRKRSVYRITEQL